MGILDDANPTRLSKRSQAVLLQVEDLEYTDVGGKGIRAGLLIPKGLDADNSISGVSLPGGICSLE